MTGAEDKRIFYPKAEQALRSKGYQYYDGDTDISQKGRSHASKPDHIAIKDSVVIIGEIKSPSEPPTSGSWRQVQDSDTAAFKAVRREVATRENAGEVPREVGGHEIIIQGQIPDYVSKLNNTYDLPPRTPEGGIIKGGYTIPSNEAGNVEKALKNCNKTSYEKLDNGNGLTTYIFTL